MVGERFQTLCRLFNRARASAEDDIMPSCVMKAFMKCSLAGVEITEEASYGATTGTG